MSASYSYMERTVGALILLAVFGFLGSVFLVGRGQHWFQQYNSYYAVYKEGYNLQPGVRVKLLRTDIGHVTKVDLKGNQVRVTMRILAEYANSITTDSQAAIESPTIIGSEFINIIPGKADKVIAPGGEIPSREAKQISDYLADYRFADKMAKLDEILANVADLTARLRDPETGVVAALEDIQVITGNVARGEGSLGRIVTGDEFFNSIDKRLDEVGRILATLQKTADTVQSAAEKIDRGAGAVEAGAGSTRDVTADLNAQVPLILTQIQQILRDLDLAVGDTPRITSDVRRNLRSVDQILESVKRNFLIRGNLPEDVKARSHGLQLRGN